MTGRLPLTVLGAGYLGIEHAASMASLGFDVLGVDTDAGKVDQLDARHIPIHEPGLGGLLQSGLTTGRLRFSTSHPKAAAFGDVHFICTGTHVVLLPAEWPEFTQLQPYALTGIVARKNIDARNFLNPARSRDAGWDYRALGIGVGQAAPEGSHREVKNYRMEMNTRQEILPLRSMASSSRRYNHAGRTHKAPGVIHGRENGKLASRFTCEDSDGNNGKS